MNDDKMIPLEIYKDELLALIHAATNQNDRDGDRPNAALRAAMATLDAALMDLIHEEDEAAGL